MGFNCLKATATSRRQFTFYHSVPRNFWYSFYRPQKDERLSRPWSHPVVLNMGPLDWKSSTLTTRPSGWVSYGPSLLLLFALEDLSEHSHICKRLILLIARNLPCCFHFAICLIVWLTSLKHVWPPETVLMARWMTSCHSLELFHGIICNIERLKEGTLLLEKGHKLEGKLILKGSGPETPLHTMIAIEVQLGLGTQTCY